MWWLDIDIVNHDYSLAWIIIIIIIIIIIMVVGYYKT